MKIFIIQMMATVPAADKRTSLWCGGCYVSAVL